MGSCIPQEYLNHIIVWTYPHHKQQDINTLGIYKIQRQWPDVLIPFLHVGGAIQEEFRLTRRIKQLDNGIVIKHVEGIKTFLQGLLDIVTKHTLKVLYNLVAPMLEAHIVETLFLQKQNMPRECERLSFLQREITQLQKWMVSVSPSTALHFLHQLKRTQMETMVNALEVKLWKPILIYCIITTRQTKLTCYRHFPVRLPNQNKIYFLKIPDHHLLPKSPKI